VRSWMLDGVFGDVVARSRRVWPKERPGLMPPPASHMVKQRRGDRGR